MLKLPNSSFRTQLNLWFVGSILSIWIILVLITGVVTSKIILRQVDHHLHTVMLETRRIWTKDNAQTRNNAIANFVSSQGMVVMVLASDGSSLLQTTSPDVTHLTQQELQTILKTQQQSGVSEDFHFTYENIRFATAPIVEQASSGIVAVGYSLHLFYQSLKQTAGIMLGITAFLLFALIWIGNIITQKALSPITSIIQTAQNIHQSGNLNARIPNRSTQDELGVLTYTLNSMLEKLQKTFEKEREFFADAAHSLKTPLSVLRVQLENLTNQTSLPKAKSKAKEAILQVDTSTDLVQGLLFLAKIESQKTDKQVNVSKIIEDIAQLTQYLADKKKISLKLDIKENLQIKGDKALLSKAIISLVENAVEYTPSKGEIMLKLEKSKNDHIKLKICDTGKGIPKQDQKKMWERFYRGESGMKSGSGSGLGLALTKAVVEKHQGTIKYSSSKKWASIFTITFS